MAAARLLFVALLMPMAAGSARPVIPPMPFACTVAGEKLLKPAMTAIAICARLQALLAPATGRSLSATRSITGKNWIRLDVRLARPGIAAATLTQSRNGVVVTHPEIAVATSDRPLDSSSIDMLGRDLVRLMDSGGRPSKRGRP